MENQLKSKSIFNRWWFWTIIIVLGLVLFFIRNARFINPPVPPKVSDEFVTKFNEINGLAVEIRDAVLPTFGDMLVSASEKESAGEYTEALQITDKALIQINSATDKAELADIKVEEFKALASAVDDATIKSVALKAASLYQQRNKVFLKLLDYDKQMWELIKIYFGKLAAGKSVSSEADEIDNLVEKVNTEAAVITKLNEELYEVGQNLAEITDLKFEE